METNLTFYKDRSVKACLSDAWKIIALNWKAYFKQLFPYLLFAGLTAAFLLEVVLQYAGEQAMPAYLLFMSDGDAETARWVACPSAITTIYIVLTWGLFLFGGLCYKARLTDTMHTFVQEGTILKKRISVQLEKTERDYMKRAFIIATLFLIAFVIVASILGWLAVKFSRWLSVAILLWGLYILPAYKQAAIQYTLLGKGLKKSVLSGLKHAWGIPFILLILSGILTAIANAAALMPVVVYTLSKLAAAQSNWAGDGWNMPAYLTMVGFLINTFCFAISCLINSYVWWTLSLKEGMRVPRP